MIQSGVVKPVNLEPVELIDKTMLVKRIEDALAVCGHTGRCEICLGMRLALTIVKGTK